MARGDVDQLLGRQCPGTIFSQKVDHHTRHHGHQRAREDFGEALGFHEGRFPQQQDGETHGRDRHRCRCGVGQVVAQQQQHVKHLVGLGRSFGACVSQPVRDLLDENDDADGGEHPLDDTCWEVLADDACARDAEHELRQASNDDRQQKGFKTHFLDAVVDNHGQACCWT